MEIASESNVKELTVAPTMESITVQQLNQEAIVEEKGGQKGVITMDMLEETPTTQ